MSWADFVDYFASQGNRVSNEYFQTHKKRFIRSFEVISDWVGNENTFPFRALDVASSGLFPLGLEKHLNFDRCDVATNSPEIRVLQYDFEVSVGDEKRTHVAFNVDIENGCFPVNAGTYDLILCFEVIEHLGMDPMYALCEFNRILKPGGMLFITTPNSSSARCLKQVLDGWHPQFHLAFNRNGSRDRHNLEYAPPIIREMIKAAGFSEDQIWTEDLFNEPLPEVIELLRSHNLPTDLRGDNLLCFVRKVSEPVSRFPDFLYH